MLVTVPRGCLIKAALILAAEDKDPAAAAAAALDTVAEADAVEGVSADPVDGLARTRLFQAA